MDDDLEQAERRADCVRAEGERRRRCEEAVHHVIRVRREADEEQQLGPLFDRADDAFDRERAREPGRYGST